MKVVQLVDSNDGFIVGYKVVTKYFDGSDMSPYKCDGYVYRMKGNEYYQRVFDKTISQVLIKKTVEDFRNLTRSELLMIRMGVYKGVQLNGYYEDGDFPEPVIFNIDDVNKKQDLGSIYEIHGFKFVHNFGLSIDVRYYGGFSNLLASDVVYNNIICASVVDLGGNVCDLAGKRILFKESGMLINGRLKGYITYIDAGRFQIFGSDLLLEGRFYSVSGSAYPEWFGCKANDESFEVFDYVSKLDSVFDTIELGSGYYYTKKGLYTIKCVLKGINQKNTALIWKVQDNNSYGVSLGKIKGTYAERNYNAISFENLTFALESDSKKTGLTAVVVGACSGAVIRDVSVRLNNAEFKLSAIDLDQFVDHGILDNVNTGINFFGDSELVKVENVRVWASVPFCFTTFTDFITVRDSLFVCGDDGISSVVYLGAGVGSQNVTFSDVSCNQGLYGVYVQDSDSWAALVNNKFDGFRVEQLNPNVKRDGAVVASSIRLGAANRYAKPSFRNLVTAGSGCMFNVGETRLGSVSFDNILSTREYSIDLPYSFKVVKSSASDANFKVYLSAVESSVYGNNVKDVPPLLVNCVVENIGGDINHNFDSCIIK